MRRAISTLVGIAAGAALFALTGAVQSAEGPGATFAGLGDLPGGPPHSRSMAVSADGSTVVGLGTIASGSRAVRWTEGEGMVDMGVLQKSKASAADAVSADGSLVVGVSFPKKVFLWRPGGNIERFRDPDGRTFRAKALSADGSVMVGELRGKLDVPRAFRWSQASGFSLIDSLSGETGNAAALGLSADGSVVVGWSDSALGAQAFRWTAESGAVGLGDLPGGDPKSVAWAVSADGDTVVGTSFSSLGQEAFRWTAKTGMIGMGSLPGYNVTGIARAVSGDGSLIVGISGFGEDRIAFLWDAEHGMRNLRDVLAAAGADVDGWVLQEAVALSHDGRTVAGTGRNQQGRVEAWRAVFASPGG